MNTNGNPREGIVSALLHTEKKKVPDNKRANGEDRLRNTMFDGLLSDEKRTEVANYFLKLNSILGNRCRFTWLITHAMVLRSETHSAR